MNHPVLFPSSLLTDQWFRRDPIRLLWWMDLVSMAVPGDGYVMSLDENTSFECKKGELITTRGILSKRWSVSRDSVKNFFVLASRKKLLLPTYYPLFTHVSICNYDDYVPSLPIFYPLFTHLEGSDDVVTHPITHPITHVNGCKSEELDTSLPTKLPTFVPTPDGERQEMREEKDENKEKNQKKIKKNKEESKEPLTWGRGSGKAESTVLTPEQERKKQEKADAREAKSEAKKEKQKALITKGREVFESFFQQEYGEPYYWEAKDAMAMKRIFQKISFRRSQKTPPLPIDDDSLVDAFDKFLRSINKTWVKNNFSMTKIDSQYNDIIAEIQNQKNNGASKQSTTQSAGTAKLAGQAESIVNDIAKADELYYRNKRGSQ